MNGRLSSAPAAALPHVRVLLATYNGAQWLDEQLRSIFAQHGVRVSVLGSDDSSSDNTPEILASWSAREDLAVLPRTLRMGSAHRNFMRLVRSADLGDAEYFALSDQDDIWLPDKLARGISCMEQTGTDAYSSNVTAFWPDGSRHRTRKAQPQRRHDYLFGSPGPGCTFVFSRRAFEAMQAWVQERFDSLQDLWVHDWLMYAFLRRHKLRWHIDPQSHMLYRQHGRNEIGVNAGWRAASQRWEHVRSGAYRREILRIAEAVNEGSPIVDAVRRLGLRDRAWLLLHVREFRRRLAECFVLAFFLLLMPRGLSR